MVLHTLGVVLDSVICVCDRWDVKTMARSRSPAAEEVSTSGF